MEHLLDLPGTEALIGLGSPDRNAHLLGQGRQVRDGLAADGGVDLQPEPQRPRVLDDPERIPRSAWASSVVSSPGSRRGIAAARQCTQASAQARVVSQMAMNGLRS